jgi:5S rRNA maturation endonuclease (ribonuclease M5)
MADISPQLQNVLDRLDGVVRVSGGFQAKCPCRDDDDNPSFSVSEGESGKVVVYCHAGRCDTAKACEAMGIGIADLYPPKPKKELKFVAKYRYLDADGTLLFEKLRYVDEYGKKEFRQRKPDGNGGWSYKLGDTPRVLYNLPAVIKAVKNGEPVWVVEGEKDADTLIKSGVCATTMPNGAGTWQQMHTDSLAGAVVEIIADNDDAGLKHAKSVYEELVDAKCDVQVWACSKGKDITDHLAAGGTFEELNSVDIGSVSSETSPEEVQQEPPKTHEGRAINEIEEIFLRDDLSESQKISRVQMVISRASSTKIVDTGRLTTWSDFVKESDDDSYDWVIPGLLERCERVIVVAAEGVGKTMLARQVAICVGSGIHPFTYQPIKPQTTLTVDLENPERIIRRTSRSIYGAAQAVSRNPNPQSHLLIKPQGLDLLRPEDRAVLEEMLERTQPALLVMGPLYKAFIDPGGRTSEAVAIEVARYLDTIRDIYQCSMWLEHHAPLGTSMTTRELRPFGSAVWSRWPEFGVALQPDMTGMAYHYDVRHFRGARDERQWPTRIKRGKRFPFEVVEFATPAT